MVTLDLIAEGWGTGRGKEGEACMALGARRWLARGSPVEGPGGPEQGRPGRLGRELGHGWWLLEISSSLSP